MDISLYSICRLIRGHGILLRAISLLGVYQQRC